MKNKFLMAGKICLVCIGVPFAFSLYIDLSFDWAYKNKKIISIHENLNPIETVIVPGAAVYGKTPSPILADRLSAALELYKAGKVKKILLSGDNGSRPYNELKPMLLFMLKNNVKKEDIFTDHAGFRTLDTLVRAKEIFEVKEAIFVSQEFHLPRAAFIADKIGMELYFFPADRRRYQSENYNRFREYFARNLAWIDMVLFHTPPKFLGEHFPISGSGEKTWKGSIL